MIAAFLDDVDLELDAAQRLVADPPNRRTAFHLQQAGEKLVKAVRLSRGLRVTADHDLEALVDELPHDDLDQKLPPTNGRPWSKKWVLPDDFCHMPEHTTE